MRAAGYCTYEGNTRSTVISIRLCELGNFLEQECMFGIDISVLVFLIHNQESQETSQLEERAKRTIRDRMHCPCDLRGACDAGSGGVEWTLKEAACAA